MSSVFLVITKDARTWAMLKDNWPSLLKEKPEKESERFMFWRLTNVYNEQAELINFLNELEEADLNSVNWLNTPNVGHYGALVINEEDGSVEEWGVPYHFGLEYQPVWHPEWAENVIRIEVSHEAPGVQ